MVRMKWMLSLLVLAAVALTTGCANHLPEYAGNMESVKVTPENSSPGPQVDLESSAHRGGGMVEMAADASGVAASVTIRKKFQNNFSDRDIVRLTGESVETSLNRNAATPFNASDQSGDGAMEVVVLRYGIDQEGATPRFFVTYRTTIFYTKEGGAKKIWKNTFRCAPGAGFWDSSNHLVTDIGFLAAVGKMSDAEFRQFVEAGFRECSNRLADRIRNAASK